MSLTESWKKIKAGAADLAEQSKQALDTAVEKSKGLAEQGKLSLENQKQAQVIADAQAQIGAYVSENNLLAEDEFVLGSPGEDRGGRAPQPRMGPDRLGGGQALGRGVQGDLRGRGTGGGGGGGADLPRHRQRHEPVQPVR